MARAAGYRSLGTWEFLVETGRGRRRAVRVHRGQRPAAGRAHRDRGGHRRRSRPAAARARPGQDAGRPRLHAGDRAGAAWRGHPGPREPGDDATRRVDAAVGRRAHRVRAAGRAGPAHRHVRLRRLRHDTRTSTRCSPRSSRPRRKPDLAARGPTRSSAALGEFRIEGAATNIAFLRAVLAAPATSSTSTADTRFVDEHVGELLDAARQLPRPFTARPSPRRRAAPACASTRPTRSPCSTSASPKPTPTAGGAGPADADLPERHRRRPRPDAGHDRQHPDRRPATRSSPAVRCSSWRR